MWPFIPRVVEKFLDLANLQRHNDNYSDIKSSMEDLAGTGRTNQTIKGNSDTVAAHLADHANPHGVSPAQIGAYSKTELQTSGQSAVHWGNLTNVPNFADARWKAPVADKTTLDTILSGNNDGDVRLVLADEYVYEWDLNIAGANKWHPIGAIGNGLTSHSALTNLGNDDHLQYLRTDGTRVLTGDQDFGQHEARNLIIHRAAASPASPVEGQPWYDTTNHALMVYKGSVSGWVDISGKGAVIKDQEFTALAGQTVFDITVGQYEISTNAITVYKKDTSTGKFELVPESEYTETTSTQFTLTSPCVGGEVFYVKFFENTPEVINQSVKRDGTLQSNLNSEFLNGHPDTYFAPISVIVAKDGSVPMTGALTLVGDPTQDLHAAPRQFVDKIPFNVYRQAIINAGLELIQRFGPLGSTILASGSSAYVADRVKSYNNGSGANATVSQVAVSDLDGATNGLKIVHAAAPTTGGMLGHTYTVEAKDSYKLAGQQVVYALKVYGVGAMNQVTINARYKTSESAISSSSTLVGSSGVKPISSTSWTIIPVVVTLPTRAVLTTSGVIGFEIVGSKTTAEASGDGFIISEMELIKANRDLGFQPRSFAEELTLCQRYYEKSYDYAVIPGTASNSGIFNLYLTGIQNTFAVGSVSFKVQKRISGATPTVYSPIDGAVGKYTIGGINKAASISAGHSALSVLQNEVSTNTGNAQFQWVVDAEI